MKFGSVWTKAVDWPTFLCQLCLKHQVLQPGQWSDKCPSGAVGVVQRARKAWSEAEATNVCVVNDFSVCDFSYVSQKNEWKSFSKPNHVVLVPKPNQTGNINDSTKVIIRWNMSTPCQQSSFWNWSRCCIQCITADLSVKPFKCKNCHLISEA